MLAKPLTSTALIWLNFFEPNENLPKCGFFQKKNERGPP
jgi:hypothetical protein